MVAGSPKGIPVFLFLDIAETAVADVAKVVSGNRPAQMLQGLMLALKSEKGWEGTQ